MFARFKERRPKMGCMVLAVLFSPALACCTGIAIGVIVPPSSLAAEPAEQAFERELQVAASLGLLPFDEQTLETDRDEHRVPVALSQGECVSVVASAWGWAVIGSLRLERDDGTVLVEHESPSGIVAHVQYCGSEAESLTASIRVHHRDNVLGRAAYSEGTLRYTISKALLPGGLDQLSRGQPTAAWVNSVPTPDLLRHADALGAGRPLLGPSIEIGSYRARLIPETAALFDELRLKAQNGDTRPMNPRIDVLPTSAPITWRPVAAPGQATPLSTLRGPLAAAVEVPAMAFEYGTRSVRVLAVIDAAALGQCVDVHLVRMRWQTTTHAHRLGAGINGTAHEHNVAHERLCGERAVYVTDASDGTAYQLRLYAAAP